MVPIGLNFELKSLKKVELTSDLLVSFPLPSSTGPVRKRLRSSIGKS